jgi:hypothetical protein
LAKEARACEVMETYRVTKVIYKLEVIADGVSFNEPRPIEGEKDLFHYRLENDELTILFKDHIQIKTAEEAQQAVDSFLRSWEIPDTLEYEEQRINELISYLMMSILGILIIQMLL